MIYARGHKIKYNMFFLISRELFISPKKRKREVEIEIVVYVIGRNERKQMRMVMLGSSPPKCVNRCKGCRPCIATLVIPPHTNKGLKTITSREDEGYYLLSWKCKCGSKYYHP